MQIDRPPRLVTFGRCDTRPVALLSGWRLCRGDGVFGGQGWRRRGGVIPRLCRHLFPRQTSFTSPLTLVKNGSLSSACVRFLSHQPSANALLVRGPRLGMSAFRSDSRRRGRSPPERGSPARESLCARREASARPTERLKLVRLEQRGPLQRGNGSGEEEGGRE